MMKQELVDSQQSQTWPEAEPDKARGGQPSQLSPTQPKKIYYDDPDGVRREGRSRSAIYILCSKVPSAVDKA